MGPAIGPLCHRLYGSPTGVSQIGWFPHFSYFFSTHGICVISFKHAKTQHVWASNISFPQDPLGPWGISESLTWQPRSRAARAEDSS